MIYSLSYFFKIISSLCCSIHCSPEVVVPNAALHGWRGVQSSAWPDWLVMQHRQQSQNHQGKVTCLEWDICKHLCVLVIYTFSLYCLSDWHISAMCRFYSWCLFVSFYKYKMGLWFKFLPLLFLSNCSCPRAMSTFSFAATTQHVVHPCSHQNIL